MDYSLHESLGSRIRRSKETHTAIGDGTVGYYDYNIHDTPDFDDWQEPVDPVFGSGLDRAEELQDKIDSATISRNLSNQTVRPDAVEAAAPQGATSTSESDAGSPQGGEASA